MPTPRARSSSCGLRGRAVEAVDVSEFIKAEASVTCKAVLLRAVRAKPVKP